MDGLQLDVEGGGVPARVVGAPVPPPPVCPVPVPRPVVLPPAPEPVPGQTDLDVRLGVDALFPFPDGP